MSHPAHVLQMMIPRLAKSVTHGKPMHWHHSQNFHEKSKLSWEITEQGWLNDELSDVIQMLWEHKGAFAFLFEQTNNNTHCGCHMQACHWESYPCRLTCQKDPRRRLAASAPLSSASCRTQSWMHFKHSKTFSTVCQTTYNKHINKGS